MSFAFALILLFYQLFQPRIVRWQE